jgi:hypothetical protein
MRYFREKRKYEYPDAYWTLDADNNKMEVFEPKEDHPELHWYQCDKMDEYCYRLGLYLDDPEGYGETIFKEISKDEMGAELFLLEL